MGALQFSSLPHSHLVQIAQLELDGWNSRQPRSVAWSIKYQLASHKVKGRILHGQHQVRLVVVAVAAIDRSTRSQCASTYHHRRQHLVVVAVAVINRSTRSQCASTCHHRRQQLVVVAVTLVVLLLADHIISVTRFQFGLNRSSPRQAPCRVIAVASSSSQSPQSR